MSNAMNHYLTLFLCVHLGSDGDTTVKEHRPSGETLNRGPDSLVTKNPRMSFERVGVSPRHPGQICPVASVHHGLLIIPIYTNWLHHCLLSTSKLVCGGRSGAIWLPSHHPGGCCTLVVVEEIPLYVKRFECPEKRYINVMNYYYYYYYLY